MTKYIHDSDIEVATSFTWHGRSTFLRAGHMFCAANVLVDVSSWAQVPLMIL